MFHWKKNEARSRNVSLKTARQFPFYHHEPHMRNAAIFLFSVIVNLSLSLRDTKFFNILFGKPLLSVIARSAKRDEAIYNHE
ncbi:MAG: hypothetical protein LBP54_03135, partial [Campylobacteraceae bacterium]|jgi:hypothetical protein|nr:hypothetical protein [Campylobacteraceae bacterium]